MIFPCGLPNRGKKKNEKKFAITKIVRIFVVLFGFKGSFTLLWLPFLKRKIGCLNDPLYHSSTRKYKHESGFSPYNEVERIVRGLFCFI